MNLADVAQQLADRADTIDGLRVAAYPAGVVQPPSLVVTMPSTYTFDQTYGRGSDRMTVPLVVLVSPVDPKVSFGLLAAYCDAVGDRSIKQVIESKTAGVPYTAFDSAVVTGITFDVYEVGVTSYPCAIFDVDIYGSGSQ